MDRSEYRRADRECTEDYSVYDARTLERIGSMYYLSFPPGVRSFAIVRVCSTRDWYAYDHKTGDFERYGRFAGEVIEAMIYGQE